MLPILHLELEKAYCWEKFRHPKASQNEGRMYSVEVCRFCSLEWCVIEASASGNNQTRDIFPTIVVLMGSEFWNCSVDARRGFIRNVPRTVSTWRYRRSFRLQCRMLVSSKNASMKGTPGILLIHQPMMTCSESLKRTDSCVKCYWNCCLCIARSY